MTLFKIETTGYNSFRDRLDAAIIQLTAQRLYNSIKEKVPEIEVEKSNVVFHTVGKELILKSGNLSSELKHKLEVCGFFFAK